MIFFEHSSMTAVVSQPELVARTDEAVVQRVHQRPRISFAALQSEHGI